MCGIIGFNWKDKILARSMCKSISHRGPDDEGFYLDNHMSLGSRRLAILDLTKKGRQPMSNKDATLRIVYNGEVYNYQELRKDLKEKGYEFKSDTDTEVILKSYQEYGPDCVNKLNGMFAFAIWDSEKQELFLARDRIGVKPLYYYFDGTKFIFASEIKAILEHDVPRVLDINALNHYLRLLYVPAPLTMFKNIFKFLPGHYAVFKNKKLRFKRYWKIQQKPLSISRSEVKIELKRLVEDSVKRRLISERPIGIFLSGGVDSSIITGIAKKTLGQGVKTFSLGFKTSVEEEKFNADLKLARKTSEWFGTEHREVIISGKDVLKNIKEVIFHMDEPVSNPTQVATFLLSKKAKEEVTVVLGGDGPDELFGGYPRYNDSRMISRFQRLPTTLKKVLLSVMGVILSDQKLRWITTHQPEERYLLCMKQKESLIQEILNKEYDDDKTTKFFKEKYFSDGQNEDFENTMMLTDVQTWLVDESLMRTDKMTMASGIEKRVPFLDHKIVELAFQTPSSWKLKGLKTGKCIFKEALQEYIPSHVANQPKRGWLSPASKWLRGDLKQLAYEVISKEYYKETERLFNFNKLREILDDHISGKKYNLNMIWVVLTFQIWAKMYKVKIEDRGRL